MQNTNLDTGTILFGLLPAGPTAHVLILAVAACVWAWALPRASIFRLFLGGVIFSAISESLQLLPIVHRGAELADFGYNVVGVVLGLAIAAFVRRVKRERRRCPTLEKGKKGRARRSCSDGNGPVSSIPGITEHGPPPTGLSRRPRVRFQPSWEWPPRGRRF